MAHAHATANQRPPRRSLPYINTRQSQKRSEWFTRCMLRVELGNRARNHTSSRSLRALIRELVKLNNYKLSSIMRARASAALANWRARSLVATRRSWRKSYIVCTYRKPHIASSSPSSSLSTTSSASQFSSKRSSQHEHLRAAPVDYEQLPVHYEFSYEQHKPLIIIY